MIDAIWVYKWKVDGHEWVVRAKLRLIARGFRPCEGVDVSETFAPVVSSSCVLLRAKLRLIARGFRPCEGVDVSETFAPVVSSSCVLLLSAIACVRDLDLCHFDVDQAFVQSDIKGGVFLRLSKGCEERSGKVVRLNKCLYGLKQASRTSHAHLTTCLKNTRF